MTEYLTREEELDLIIKAQAGDKSAMGELLERHRNFIWKCARRYHLRSQNALEIEDCVQIATIGVMKAVREFRTDSGFALLTFAFRCVQSEFSLHLQYNSVIKCPRKQKRVPVKFLDGMGEARTSIAHTLVSPEPEVSDIDRMEAIADGRRYLEMLSGRERDVMERRMNGETLNEISVTYKISKERIRQVEALALRKLRLVASINTKGKHAHESTVGV